MIEQASLGAWVATADGQVGIVIELRGAAAAITTPDLATVLVDVDQLVAHPVEPDRYAERYLRFADAFADAGYAAQFHAVGLGPVEAAGWANLGFSPIEATRWSAAGFGAHEACAYAERRITPQRARQLVTWPEPHDMPVAA